jgi:cytochrome c
MAASSVALYFYFRPNSDYSGDESNLVEIKNFASRNGLITSLLIPILVAFLVISTGLSGLSYSVFLMAILVLVIVILISNLYYVMLRKSNTQYSMSILFLMIILILSVVGINIAALDSSTKLQFNHLAEKYDAYKQQLLIDAGAFTVTVSGEDIYNGRCIACHKFDQKLVGPPYNEVLPKYADNRAGLINFILNPTKVNPEYPSMPSQGLKPNEAEAIADYILNMYNQQQ